MHKSSRISRGLYKSSTAVAGAAKAANRLLGSGGYTRHCRKLQMMRVLPPTLHLEAENQIFVEAFYRSCPSRKTGSLG